MEKIIGLRCAEKSAGKVTYGIGYNWADFLGMGGCYAGEPELYPLNDKVYPEVSDEAGWHAVMEGLDLLKPGIIRFGIPPDPLVGDRPGEINTASVHFRRLERVARWAEKNDCAILLDTFFIPEKYGFPIPKVHGRYTNMAPRDNRSYVREFILPLLCHLVDELGLSAIKLFSPVNEPAFSFSSYGTFQTPGNNPNPYAHYVEMCREIKDTIESDRRLRGKIGLIGMDVVGPKTFFSFWERLKELKIDLNPYVDLYSVHYYFHRFDWSPPCEHFGTDTIAEVMDDMTSKVVSDCRSRGKQLIAAEMGNGYFGFSWKETPGADPAGHARPESALLTAETALRGLNAGLCGVAFWSLFNPDTIDGWWSVMAVENGKLVKRGHKWNTFGLLSRYIRPGCTCFPLVPVNDASKDSNVHGSCFEKGDAKVYVLINDSWCDAKKVQFYLPSDRGMSAVKKLTNGSLGMMETELQPVKDKSDIYVEDILTPMSISIFQV